MSIAPHRSILVATLAAATLIGTTLIGTTSAAAGTPEVVWSNFNDNGYFVPFTALTPSDFRYADSGWLGGPGADPVPINRVRLGLAVFDSPTPGTTDLTFTFNEGNPSGLIFGSGVELYSTVVRGVELPATLPGAQELVTVEITLPSVMTLGNFNDIGWSLGVEHFKYAGSFGFQVASAKAQTVGFYTNNAASFDGFSWSLFAFGGDPVTGIASFVAEFESGGTCIGDLNVDGSVDGADLGLMLTAWGGVGSADLNEDGIVDGADLGLLLTAWGACDGN